MCFNSFMIRSDASLAQIDTVYSSEDCPSPSAPISKAINSTILLEIDAFAPYPISSLLEI